MKCPKCNALGYDKQSKVGCRSCGHSFEEENNKKKRDNRIALFLIIIVSVIFVIVSAALKHQ